MPEFPSEPTVEIARRLEIRGDDSSSWVAMLAPEGDAQSALDGLQADLSALLQRSVRFIDLKVSTFEELRAKLHEPSDDIVILVSSAALTPDQWSSVDLMRSALERKGPLIFWITAESLANLSEFAPNIRSFVGPSIFAAGPEGSFMSDEERDKRIQELVDHYGYSSEEFIKKIELKEMSPDPRFIEWLILLGRGDLV